MWPRARSALAGTADVDAREHGGHHRGVVHVIAGEHPGQRPSLAVRDQVNLAGQPTAGTADRMIRTAGHLAAYVGLAPVTRRSGSSIHGEYSSRRGNKVLKNTMFLSAFAALRDPDSRTYYDRKISQGKRHNQALLALAQRRSDVLFAMLRDGTLYAAPERQIAA